MAASYNQTALEYIMTIPALKQSFVSDMIMNGVFTFIGIIVQAVSSARKDKSNQMTINR